MTDKQQTWMSIKERMYERRIKRKKQSKIKLDTKHDKRQLIKNKQGWMGNTETRKWKAKKKK